MQKVAHFFFLLSCPFLFKTTTTKSYALITPTPTLTKRASFLSLSTTRTSLSAKVDNRHFLKMSINEDDGGKADEKKINIVIAGAGVIGTSTAYYLAKNHKLFISSITMVDPTASIAPAASGKAGGFLALDWNDHSAVGPLARRSFELHQELADTLGADDIMYRRLNCASISVSQFGQKRPAGRKLEGVEWVDNVATRVRSLGNESTIAQVHPKLLCEKMFDSIRQCSEITSSLRKGKVIGAIYEDTEKDNSKLIGAKLDDGSTIEADAILFSCGPWTEQGKCMLGVKYHSAIIPTNRVLNQSVFFDGCGDPEIYPRPDKTAYCTGFPDPAIRVVESPGEEAVREDAIQRIVGAVRDASGGKDGELGSDPVLRQSCYLPTTLDGLPMIGEVKKSNNCYIASGHGCWGILMGPATGEAMASLIVTGKSKEINLSPFRPERFEGMEMW